eukprot:gene13647-13763_t
MSCLGLAGCVDTAGKTALAPSASDVENEKIERLAGANMAAAPLFLLSLDGAPPAATTVLVADLQKEAAARQIALSDMKSAKYLARGYFSVVGEGETTRFLYVWDVADVARHETHRLTDAVLVKGTAPNLWSVFSADIAAELAAKGADDLAALLSNMPERRYQVNIVLRQHFEEHVLMAEMRKAPAMKILAGNSNTALAESIAAYLGEPLTKCQVRRFADMEIFVEIQENVRGQDAFIIQSTSYPTNDHLMEVLIMSDALRRASAKRITAVIPYFGYARQDRKPGPRTPISAKLVANLITRAGADRVLTVDLHAGQIQGFFDIPTDNLYGAPVMVRDIKERMDLRNVMVVSPDVGGVVRARALAKRIDAPLAIVDKRRERAGESEVMNIIGDVTGKSCILVDDIIDSGGTLCNAAEALLAKGASEVYAYITHGVLSGGAVARVAASKLKELVLTDTILPTEAVRVAKNIRVISIAPLIGEAIQRTAREESVSSLFD